MKKYIAILAAALAAPALAGALDGVPVLGTAPGGVTIYDKPCLSGNKADEGFVAVRGQQAGCFIEEGNYKARIEWLSSGRIERVDEAKTRAPAPPVYRDQFGNQTKSPLQLCKESRAAGNPVTEFCFRQFQGEAWFGPGGPLHPSDKPGPSPEDVKAKQDAKRAEQCAKEAREIDYYIGVREQGRSYREVSNALRGVGTPEDVQRHTRLLDLVYNSDAAHIEAFKKGCTQR